MGRKCEYYYCPNRQGKSLDKSFFKFPTDEELCRKWVELCESPEATAILNDCGVQAFKSKIVCSDHFSTNCFRSSLDSSKGLLPGATPHVPTRASFWRTLTALENETASNVVISMTSSRCPSRSHPDTAKFKNGLDYDLNRNIVQDDPESEPRSSNHRFSLVKDLKYRLDWNTTVDNQDSSPLANASSSLRFPSVNDPYLVWNTPADNPETSPMACTNSFRKPLGSYHNAMELEEQFCYDLNQNIATDNPDSTPVANTTVENPASPPQIFTDSYLCPRSYPGELDEDFFYDPNQNTAVENPMSSPLANASTSFHLPLEDETKYHLDWNTVMEHPASSPLAHANLSFRYPLENETKNPPNCNVSIDNLNASPLANVASPLNSPDCDDIEFIQDSDYEAWMRAVQGVCSQEVPAAEDPDFNQSRLKQELNVSKQQLKAEQGKRKRVSRKLYVSEQKSKRRQQTVQRLKAKNKDLKQRLAKARKEVSEDAKLGKKAKKNPVILDTLKNSGRTAHGRRYSRATLKFSSGLYLSGPRSYRYLRKTRVLTLPSKSTVHRFNRNTRLGAGINRTILQKMGQRVKKMQPRDKIVRVAIDGMSIRADLTYSAKADEFYGFPSDGVQRKIEQNDPERLATEAVVVMASGLYRRYKQPFGYVLAHNTMNSKAQLKFLKKSVRSLRRIGLRPISVAMDQSSTNTKMCREAGVKRDYPLLDIDNEPVAVIFDPPHTIKNARNAFFKYNAVFDGAIASFSHIKQLFENDIKGSLRLVPKLTHKALFLPPFLSMNVALAVRVLSASTGGGIRYYVQVGDLPEVCLNTAQFVEFHDILFDIMNSKDKYTDSIGKPYRTPITEGSIHFGFLDAAIAKLKSMYFIPNTCFDIEKAKEASKLLKSSQRRPPYLSGMIQNIHAIRWIWDQLGTDYKYLCTNPLDQDDLENFFSEMRRRGGFNFAPNAFEFASSFKYGSIEAGNNTGVYGKNCQDDDCVAILGEDDLEDVSDEAPVVFHYDFEPIDDIASFETTTKDMNALVFIAGAAVHALPHQCCRKKLTTKAANSDLDDDYLFCKIKAAFSKKSVNFPNNILYEIVVLVFASFKLKFRQFLYENRRNVKQRLKAYLDYSNYEGIICHRCFDRLIDYIINTLIQGFLREVRHKRKLAEQMKRKWGKRNRKAICLDLP